MRRKIPAFLLLLFWVPAVLAGCMRENNDFVYDLDGAPQNLDPQSAADPASRLVIANIFEGLATVGADGGIRAGAAESWTVSEDGLTYEFTLREDGKWSNGDPVTAEDFVYGFRRLFDRAGGVGFPLHPGRDGGSGRGGRRRDLRGPGFGKADPGH